MNCRFFYIFPCIVALYGGAFLNAASPPKPTSKSSSMNQEGPKIRVLLEKNVVSALLEAKGEYIVVDRGSGELLSSGSLGKRFVIHALQNGLRWGEEYPDVFQIVILPKSPTTTLYLNGMQYRGAIAVYHCKDNVVTIVNEVPIEDYIKSVLSLQITESVSKEALAAFVIAQRSEAFAKTKMNIQNKKPWDITAQEDNYFGYSVTRQNNAIEEAVDWTRFMVLEFEGTSHKMDFSLEKAIELADRGFDAKKILQNSCPASKLGVTSLPKAQRVVR